MSLIINEKRKQSVQYEPKSSIILNKLAALQEEKPNANAKKKGHAKTRSNIEYSGSIIENKDNIINNDNDYNYNEDDDIGFQKAKSKGNEDNRKGNVIFSSINQPKGSFDISSLHNRMKTKPRDFKMNHIPSSFSAKKEKGMSMQKNVYTGLSSAGRNMRGETKINQDSIMTIHHVFNTSFTYHILGVFDGHGPNGHYVSDYLKTYFTKWFTSNDGVNFIKKWTCAKVKEKVECFSLMKKNYSKAEEQMIKAGVEHKDSGSTGIIIAILIDFVLCFNTGDSRAIYISADGLSHQISEDHKPNNPNEEKRITKQGGKVESRQEDDDYGPYRVFSKSNKENGLAISRSIGDFEMKDSGVISDPDYFELSLRTNRIKAIILGSDGIWDMLTNDEVKEIIEPYFITKDSAEACKQLIKTATEGWLAGGVNVDDISVIVYFP